MSGQYKEFSFHIITPEEEYRFNHNSVVAFQGNTGWHGQGYYVEATLYPLSSFDETFISVVDVKPNEVIYRYSTDKMFFGEQHLIKINQITGRAYLLSEDSIECGSCEFQSKGFKLDYLNILA